MPMPLQHKTCMEIGQEDIDAFSLHLKSLEEIKNAKKDEERTLSPSKPQSSGSSSVTAASERSRRQPVNTDNGFQGSQQPSMPAPTSTARPLIVSATPSLRPAQQSMETDTPLRSQLPDTPQSHVLDVAVLPSSFATPVNNMRPPAAPTHAQRGQAAARVVVQRGASTDTRGQPGSSRQDQRPTFHQPIPSISGLSGPSSENRPSRSTFRGRTPHRRGGL